MGPPSKQIADEWRALPAPGFTWRECENQAGLLGQLVPGEAGGLMVTCDRIGGRRAYMKPRRRDPSPKRARAAREKIAADLAHDLGVPVPPVVLARRLKAGADEDFVCVSLVMYPRQWSWEELKLWVAGPAATVTGQLLLRTLPTAAAAALAFDTWVGQTDHNDHPHNVIFGYDPDNPDDSSWMFLDYAMAFGFNGAWEEDRFRACTAAPFPPLMLQHVDHQAVGKAVEAIEAVPDATVNDVVGRIPDSHLRPDERRRIAEALVARRGLVRDALSSYMLGATTP